MSISLDYVFSRNENIVFRKIEDEYVLVPMLTSSDEVEHIYNLNRVGAAVWERIDGKRSVREIVDELAKVYDEARGQIETDVLAFVDDIYQAKIIRALHERS